MTTYTLPIPSNNPNLAGQAAGPMVFTFGYRYGLYPTYGMYESLVWCIRDADEYNPVTERSGVVYSGTDKAAAETWLAFLDLVDTHLWELADQRYEDGELSERWNRNWA